MRKLLSLLGAISLIATSSATVVACGQDEVVPPVVVNYDELVKSLKNDVNEIFWKHLNDNVYKNLVGLPDTESQYYFLNRTKIIENSNLSAEDIDPFDLQQLEKDIKKVLEVDQLSMELNKLKNVNEYKVILNDVNDLLKAVVIDWKSLIIKSYESSAEDKLYLGNVIVDYKIQIQYKGEKSIETFDIDENFKYTSTNSDSLKKASDDFYKNIAKDYFSSTDSNDKKHTNLNWEDIKDKKKSYEGLGKTDKEFKKYYQDDSKTNGFEKSLIDFIKKNYFEKVGNTLPLSFEGDLIYKSSEMSNYSMFDTINKFKKYNSKSSVQFDYKEDSGRIFLNTIFRNNPNDLTTKNNLLTHYFKKTNYDIWKSDFEIKKESFLEGLKLENESSIKESSEYKSSTALGYVNLTGLSINLANGIYIHELPDFKLAVNYMVDINQSDAQILDKIAEFSVENLKIWHKVFGVSHNYEYPDYNSNEDFLMSLKSSKLTDEMTKKFPDGNNVNANLTSHFNEVFTLKNSPYLVETRENLLNETNIIEDSLYSIGINDLAQNSNAWTYSAFDWTANKKTGINIKANGKSEQRNNKNLYFILGYVNFYIDLDKITMGAIELGDKELVKFI
ncbi:lipoprotein [Spiroplasma endosymbiont of Cantharis nigra]|uniref:lipoprotein n=1 Tax=Spiroplasma endosymbiont of Cantharis nigra TaxID=3066278 RepID=UPI0030D129FE